MKRVNISPGNKDGGASGPASTTPVVRFYVPMSADLTSQTQVRRAVDGSARVW